MMSKLRIITSAEEMTLFSLNVRDNRRSVGFVPTMGALHEGHASLIKAAKQGNDKVVVSVFVNPTQFNDTNDLLAYPRTFDSDRKLLAELDVDVMFYPSEKEIYPDRSTAVFDMDGLDSGMEGPNRPGHFNGVVAVVMRLFDIVLPERAYFGEKDFQQLCIIRHVTKKIGRKVDVIGCPTMRESDGLAMSSRNVRLSSEARRSANTIYRALLHLRARMSSVSLAEAHEEATQMLSNVKGLQLEYLELVNPDTLRPIETDAEDSVQACVAAWLAGVRLIDNLRVK